MTDEQRKRIEAADEIFRGKMKAALGSPSAQHERLEALIDALDAAQAQRPIDKTSNGYWKAR